MRVVLDTNILVSGFMTFSGHPARIVDLAATGRFQTCLSLEILAEYEEVLGRADFGFNAENVKKTIALLKYHGLIVKGEAWQERLPDPSDAKFLEAAVAGCADYVVTGNLKHFPKSLCVGLKILPPSDFIKLAVW